MENGLPTPKPATEEAVTSHSAIFLFAAQTTPPQNFGYQCYAPLAQRKNNR